jgi:hypothetical protein
MRRLVVLLIAGFALSSPVWAADDILDARVTIDFRDAPGGEVITAVARGAGLSVAGVGGDLHTVTITLTNVKLSNALNAICDNALCSWRLDAGVLRITHVPAGKVAALPAHLSLELHGATPREVLRAVATALGVGIVIDVGMSSGPPMNLNFVNAPTAVVLDAVCREQNCEWSFDGTGTQGILRFTQKP